MRPAHEDPAAVLRRADAVLRAMQPAFTASFHLVGMSYRARFSYPGVVEVFDRHTGELVARSRPGVPHELASSGHPA